MVHGCRALNEERVKVGGTDSNDLSMLLSLALRLVFAFQTRQSRLKWAGKILPEATWYARLLDTFSKTVTVRNITKPRIFHAGSSNQKERRRRTMKSRGASRLAATEWFCYCSLSDTCSHPSNRHSSAFPWLLPLHTTDKPCFPLQVPSEIP